MLISEVFMHSQWSDQGSYTSEMIDMTFLKELNESQDLISLLGLSLSDMTNVAAETIFDS